MPITEKRSKLIEDFLKKIPNSEYEKTKKRMLLAAKIKDAMLKEDINNTELAEKMGRKNVSQVTKWLSGTHNFTTDLLFELEEVLKITLVNTSDKDYLTSPKYNLSIILSTNHRSSMPKQNDLEFPVKEYTAVKK